MQKIKKGDEVIVLAGKDKGRHGKVLKMQLAAKKALVEGINLIKKHVKPNPQTQTTGGVVTREASIHLSNLALYNPVTKKADKVGFRLLEDGRKVRYFKSTKELVDIG
jgi:large subunit ribosomal protein L24